jgi:hypothetical protein
MRLENLATFAIVESGKNKTTESNPLGPTNFIVGRFFIAYDLARPTIQVAQRFRLTVEKYLT